MSDAVEITPAQIEAGVPYLLEFAAGNDGPDAYDAVRNIVIAVLGATPAEEMPVDTRALGKALDAASQAAYADALQEGAK